jgi:hypothetical protein
MCDKLVLLPLLTHNFATPWVYLGCKDVTRNLPVYFGATPPIDKQSWLDINEIIMEVLRAKWKYMGESPTLT